MTGREGSSLEPRVSRPLRSGTGSGRVAVEEKRPALGILIDIESAYTQCSKAFIRSDCWNPARHVAREAMPTGGVVLREVHGDDFDAGAYDAARAERYARREGFY